MQERPRLLILENDIRNELFMEVDSKKKPLALIAAPVCYYRSGLLPPVAATYKKLLTGIVLDSFFCFP